MTFETYRVIMCSATHAMPDGYKTRAGRIFSNILHKKITFLFQTVVTTISLAMEWPECLSRTLNMSSSESENIEHELKGLSLS